MLRLVRHGRPPDLRSRPSGRFDQLLLDFSNVYLDLLQYALGCHSLELPPQTPLSVCGAGGLLLVLPRPPSMWVPKKNLCLKIHLKRPSVGSSWPSIDVFYGPLVLLHGLPAICDKFPLSESVPAHSSTNPLSSG